MIGVGGECFCCEKEIDDFFPFEEPKPFSLPSPLPLWPLGKDFASGKICLGEIEVVKITKFTSIWNCTHSMRGKINGAIFYKPVDIPNRFFTLGHYCQPCNQPLKGYVLVARETDIKSKVVSKLNTPPLKEPIGYTLMWGTDSRKFGCGYVWLPEPPLGYRAMGLVVTDGPEMPNLDEVRCVREDLTESCETYGDIILETDLSLSKSSLKVWNMRPSKRGIKEEGVCVGTFFGTTTHSTGDELYIACLRNANPTLHAMPTLDQVHALIKHYGPTVFFHPDEVYMPSSVPWFFKNGAMLFLNGKEKGERIDSKGSNLPCGGLNDGEYWIDLPEDEDERKFLKHGNIDSSELYVHVKPALGGTFTDIAMWVFCPFNGPSTIKASFMSLELSKVGEHVGDWEHFTLRISNFTGELTSVYFSSHSCGEWVHPCELEFIQGSKCIVYSSKDGHASFSCPGSHIIGSSKLGIGLRNDTARSKYFVDSSTRYRIISAEYLGEGEVAEPDWLQYMREWGPTVVYNSRTEIDKIISHFPMFLRFSVNVLFELFPSEIYGEEGPTGPKEKDNWLGDERW